MPIAPCGQGCVEEGVRISKAAHLLLLLLLLLFCPSTSSLKCSSAAARPKHHSSRILCLAFSGEVEARVPKARSIRQTAADCVRCCSQPIMLVFGVGVVAAQSRTLRVPCRALLKLE